MLTDKLIETSIKNFWKERVLKYKNLTAAQAQERSSHKHLILCYRALAADSTIFTLGPMIRVNINESSMEYIIKKIITILSLKNDGYKNKGLNSIIFHYGFVDGVAPNTKNNVLEKSGIYQNYRHYKLPFFLDPLKYGLLLHEEDRSESGHFYILQNNNGNTFKILQTIDPITGLIHNNVELFRQGVTGLVYTDQEISNGIFTDHKVSIGSNKYYCSTEKGMEFFHTIKQNKFIKTGVTDKTLNQDIITLDLETYQTKVCPKDSQVRLMPYLISFYDGVTSISNYLTDFVNSDLMILDCLNQLISIKYDGFKVYVHNLSNFDSLFMLNILQNNFDINLTRNKGRIISIKVSKTIPNPLFRDKEKVISLTFYDSYQLLPSSLRKLGLSFNTITQKDIFPYNFVNKDNLNYVGPVPSMEFFPTDTFSSIDEYNHYKMNNFDWNLKQISIDYCNKDCISLHQVLIKFSNLIWDKYTINITKFPTLTSLTFNIYRTHFLGTNKIPMLAGKFYTDLKMAYTGGATDMYIPTNLLKNNISSSSILSKVFKNAWKVICILYYYDVNSLYPYIMSQFELPCGKIVYFEGNIYNPDLVINNIIPQGVLGFYYCKVIAPTNLMHPIIQLRHNNTTLAPLGSFECMLYNKEIENARKYGYDIQVL